MQHKQRETCHDNEPRVPLALQSVFLRGNRGLDVHAPPPDYRKSWWRLYFSSDAKNAADKKQNERYSSNNMSSRPKTKVVKTKSAPTLSPQQYLDGLIRSRGYSAMQYPVLSSAYHNKPSPLQIASYGIHVVNLVNQGNCEALDELMKLGLSPNACNAHGESIVNHVCRRVDDVRMLDILLKAGCVVQTSDQNGRTPLHHAFWAVTPNFSMVEKLLEQDVRLLYMADSHGHLPLSYIRKEHWSDWLQFFQARKEVYWPRTVNGDSSAAPPLTQLKPHTRLIRDPDHALSLELAKMVASGKLRIKEVKFLMKTLNHDIADIPYNHMDFDDDDCGDEYDDYDDDSSYADDSSSSEDEESILDNSSHSTIESNDTASESKTTHDDENSESESLEDDEIDTESWYEMKKTLQGLSSPMLRPIDW